MAPRIDVPASRDSRERVIRRVLATIDACDRLPVLDRALRRVLALADEPTTSIADLSAAMEADAALAAGVLRFANSGAAGRPMRITTVRQAVVMVGRRGVRHLALESVAYRFFEKAPGNGRASRGQLHSHAVQVARVAARCAERAGVPADVPHLAGLLHDCGKLVLPLAFGDDVLDAIAEAHADGGDRARAERRHVGMDHAAAGALFALASGVAPEVQAAIAAHHGGNLGISCPDPASACVQLADAVCGAVAGRPLDDALCAAALQVLGLPYETLDELAELVLAGDGAGGDALAQRLADLERLAHTDELTGIANRRRFTEVLRDRLAAGGDGQLLLVDVDHFKRVNDDFGHRAGDLVLMEVARLAGHVGDPGRLGGDEFAVWVDGDADAGLAAADALVRGIREACAPEHVTLSVGVADAGGGDDLTELLEVADRALYAAKDGGRDRAVHAARAGVRTPA